MAASISVVMVTYHSGPVLWLALDAALAQPECLEVILIENGNPAQVSEQLAKMTAKEPRLHYLPQSENLGFAKACNQGAKEAQGEYLVFLNPDCVLEPGDFQRMLGHLQANPEVWLAGARHFRPDGTTDPASIRNFLMPDTFWGEWLRRVWPFLSPAQKPVPLNLATPLNDLESVQPVPAISGALMCLPASRFQQLGGMDEQFFLHVEDLDLCARVEEMGGKTLYMGDVRTTHYGATSRIAAPRMAALKRDSFLYYFRKHFADRPVARAAIFAAVWLRFLLQWLFGWLRRTKEQRVSGRLRRELLFLRSLRRFAPGELLKGRRIAVTGATGQVGVAVVAALVQQGAEVVPVGRRQWLWYGRNHLHWVEFNLHRAEPWPELEHLDMLVHCGPLTALPAHLESMRDAGLKRVLAFHANSILGTHDLETKLERQTAGQMKQAEEILFRECEKERIACTILRPTDMYGMGMDTQVSLIARIMHAFGVFPLYPPADGRRRPVHVLDLAQAALQALDTETTHNNAYVLSGATTVTYRELVEQVASVLAEKIRIFRLSFLPQLVSALQRFWGMTLPPDFAERMNTHQDASYQEALRDFQFAPQAFLAGGVADIHPLEHWEAVLEQSPRVVIRPPAKPEAAE